MSETSNERAGGVVSGWGDFGVRLGEYLTTMVDDDDMLLVESPEVPGEGTSPYIQVCNLGSGRLRMEVSGNRVLSRQFRLTREQLQLLRENQGWHLPRRGDECPNLWLELDEGADAADCFAWMACEVLSEVFSVPFPEFLTYDASGPAAEGAESLGLCRSGFVPVDVVDQAASGAPPIEPPAEWAELPRDRDHLVELTREVLTRHLGQPPEVDQDGDFVLRHNGAPLFVSVRDDLPVVDLFLRVVHDVRSRRQAAVEVNLLNRNHPVVKFLVSERNILAVISVPAAPLAHLHLLGMAPLLAEVCDGVVDDLTFRTQGKKG